jgi:hypothetical protein
VSARAPHHQYFGRPVFRCRWCKQRYERVDNLQAVLEHEQLVHGTAAEEEDDPAPRVRESALILGPDGNPALVADDGPAFERR